MWSFPYLNRPARGQWFTTQQAMVVAWWCVCVCLCVCVCAAGSGLFYLWHFYYFSLVKNVAQSSNRNQMKLLSRHSTVTRPLFNANETEGSVVRIYKNSAHVFTRVLNKSVKFAPFIPPILTLSALIIMLLKLGSLLSPIGVQCFQYIKKHIFDIKKRQKAPEPKVWALIKQFFINVVPYVAGVSKNQTTTPQAYGPT